MLLVTLYCGYRHQIHFQCNPPNGPHYEGVWESEIRTKLLQISSWWTGQTHPYPKLSVLRYTVLLSKQRWCQVLADQFWTGFTKDYIPSLQTEMVERHSWMEKRLLGPPPPLLVFWLPTIFTLLLLSSPFPPDPAQLIILIGYTCVTPYISSPHLHSHCQIVCCYMQKVSSLLCCLPVCLSVAGNLLAYWPAYCLPIWKLCVSA